jgi:hypothetical protein
MFSNLVLDLKSDDPIPRYPNFSGSTPAKSSFPGKIEKLKNCKYRQFLTENYCFGHFSS